MKLRNLQLILLTFLVLTIISCKKDQSDWEWCLDCSWEQLIGEYAGKATSSTFQGDELPWLVKEDVDISIIINGNSNNLQLNANIINDLNDNYSIGYNNSYYLTKAPGFNANIWKKDNEIKLIGTIKKYQGINTTIKIVDFEVIKKQG
ncbi:MAG: hypothetical protein Q8J88_06525 [Bacteroidales bacterium]|nr:hypothetical protein [Bacteroidales bacterium]